MKRFLPPLLFLLAVVGLGSIKMGWITSGVFTLPAVVEERTAALELQGASSIKHLPSETAAEPPVETWGVPTEIDYYAGVQRRLEGLQADLEASQVENRADETERSWKRRQEEMLFVFRAWVSGIVLVVSLLMGAFGKDEGSRRWAFGMVGTVLGFWLR